jgi:hypothetical protein
VRTAQTLGITALLFGIAARAQVFEAADVHPITVAIDSVMRGGYLRNGRYELRNATMADLIGAAYGVAVDKVAGGPQWIDIRCDRERRATNLSRRGEIDASCPFLIR